MSWTIWFNVEVYQHGKKEFDKKGRRTEECSAWYKIVSGGEAKKAREDGREDIHMTALSYFINNLKLLMYKDRGADIRERK